MTAKLSSRAYWSIVDQGISSVSSFVFVASVARGSGVEELGQFALAYLAYGFVLGVGRAVGGDVLLLRAEQPGADVEGDCRRLLGLALALSGVAAVPFAAVSVLAAGTLGSSLLALATVLPVLLTQDALRYCLFATKRPQHAAAIDLLWLAVQLIATVGLLVAVPDAAPAAIIFAWASGALVAGAVGLLRAGLLPTRRRVLHWLTHDRARTGSFFTDFALMTGSNYVAVYLIAIIAGYDDVAAVRGCLLLFAPLDALFLGVQIFTLPALARGAARSGADARRIARAVGGASAALTAAWSAIVIVLPAGVGEAVLGATWSVAKPLVPAIAVASTARYAALSSQAGLRALGDVRRLVAVRGVATALLFCGIVAGAALDGAQGAAAGLATAAVTAAALWWRGFARSSHRVALPARD